MSATVSRLPSFDVCPVESDAAGTRWHWTVSDGPHGCSVRDGQVTGDRDRAERAAIALAGGVGL